MKMMGSAGSFVGPYVIGITSDASGSFTPAMLMLAACLLGASGMQLFFKAPGTAPSIGSLTFLHHRPILNLAGQLVRPDFTGLT